MVYINGKVVEGKKFGRTIGFPTANVTLTKKTGDKHGLTEGTFATISRIDAINYYSLSGVCILGDKYIIETHIFCYYGDVLEDTFKSDIYGFSIEILFMSKIREKTIIKSKRELTQYINQDKEDLKKYFDKRYDTSCNKCSFFYQQDSGYSNYTVTGSSYGCYVNKFEEIEDYVDVIDNKYTSLHALAILSADLCDTFRKGDFWQLDVDGEKIGPDQDLITQWLREVKIDKLIN